MTVPQLYRQLQVQLRQWITPKDRRHLQVFSENVGAILQAQSACLSHWIPYLSHRDCAARSHMERLRYFVHHAKIDAETFYHPPKLSKFAAIHSHYAPSSLQPHSDQSLTELLFASNNASGCKAQVIPC
jgi:hypothetical protein